MIKGRTKAVRLLGCLLGIWLAGCGGGGGGDAGGGNSGGGSARIIGGRGGFPICQTKAAAASPPTVNHSNKPTVLAGI